MDDEAFWQIIEETHDTSMEEQEEKLGRRLEELSEAEIIEFERLECLRVLDLYSWELWGVAHLHGGYCSDDGFTDWRHWVVFCGKEVFETARDHPDDLVPVIDTHPAAGCEGIGYVAMNVLREKFPKWQDAFPEFDLPRPGEPRGKRWKEEELKELLPKTYKRYVEDATEMEQRMKDPNYVIETFGVKLGEPQSFTLQSEEIEIDGRKATRTHFLPVKKKPWWKFWSRN
ncbi:MAG TPA: DUF4240 domain-containing protein [Chthoniobacteraceae bacterium]|nr:DUF4240 domain-containing protein [Chthoniobacteraceae bacterium]